MWPEEKEALKQAVKDSLRTAIFYILAWVALMLPVFKTFL